MRGASAAAGLVAAAAFLLGTEITAAAASPESLRPPPGALSCGGCHGARPRDGALLPRIAGRPADEIVAALAAFRSGERAATVMGRIAKGFGPDEDRAIAAWLAEQR